MVLAGVHETSLPEDIATAFIDLDLLKGYSLVTSTVSCRGYAFALSNKGKCVLRLVGLRTTELRFAI